MWEGEKGGAFCSVCIFQNQKMHIYLIVIEFEQIEQRKDVIRKAPILFVPI